MPRKISKRTIAIAKKALNSNQAVAAEIYGISQQAVSKAVSCAATTLFFESELYDENEKQRSFSELQLIWRGLFFELKLAKNRNEALKNR